MRNELLQHIQKKASHLAFDNPLYHWSLKGGVPDGFVASINDSWPGDAAAGRALCDSMVPRDPDASEPKLLRSLFGFEALRDLKAMGGDEARRCARALIENWMHRHGRWEALSWRPDLTGLRVANWITFHDFYGACTDRDLETQILESLAQQAKHLSRALPGDESGLPLLYGIRGLIYAGLVFAGREQWLVQGLDLLEHEASNQILPDGGHVSRNPAALIDTIRLFTDIRAALAAAEYPVPDPLVHTIDRMTQALRFFRYPDRNLALFNGTQEGDADYIDKVIFKTGLSAQARILRSLPQSGYERLSLGRSLVMVDAGAPAASPHDGASHAAPLAFEFIYGKERLIVSCGSHPDTGVWRESLRATAAHNTMVIESRNASEIRDNGRIGRRPQKMDCKREDTRDGILFDGSHDGYAALNGLTHRCRLFLSDGGHDFRGEDSLTSAVPLTKQADIALRFHLHPKVTVSLISNGTEALLRLPGGSGWRFTHSGGALSLEDSLYLGQGSEPRKTQQLVVRGYMDTDFARIKWALQREGA